MTSVITELLANSGSIPVLNWYTPGTQHSIRNFTLGHHQCRINTSSQDRRRESSHKEIRSQRTRNLNQISRKRMSAVKESSTIHATLESNRSSPWNSTRSRSARWSIVFCRAALASTCGCADRWLVVPGRTLFRVLSLLLIEFAVVEVAVL